MTPLAIKFDNRYAPLIAHGYKDVTRRTWTREKCKEYERAGTVRAVAGGVWFADLEIVSTGEESIWQLVVDRQYGIDEIHKEGSLWMTPFDFAREMIEEYGVQDLVQRIEFKVVNAYHDRLKHINRNKEIVS